MRTPSKPSPPYAVVDLFSGAGGMSFGFHAHPAFRLVGAADIEIGKPSDGPGRLQCNSTFEANIGLRPLAADLSTAKPEDISGHFGFRRVDVLAACPPCTGFSRTLSSNHLIDDPRNSLVSRVAVFARAWKPRVIVMENARELLMGRFTAHFALLRRDLEAMGYSVQAAVHFLTRFGLPQQRERALVIATMAGHEPRTLEDLWSGYRVAPGALTVRRAIGDMPPLEAGRPHPSDPMHVATTIESDSVIERLRAMPKDGGSWNDLIDHPQAKRLLIPSMWRAVRAGTPNHHCDVYGRMAWDRPAPTIKRECSHIGNGRYAHPEQDRICSVREMAILQGFPRHYVFRGRSTKAMYRNIGDAVPPMVSHQIAHVCSWILGNPQPSIADAILADTHLTATDLLRDSPKESLLFA